MLRSGSGRPDNVVMVVVVVVVPGVVDDVRHAASPGAARGRCVPVRSWKSAFDGSPSLSTGLPNQSVVPTLSGGSGVCYM